MILYCAYNKISGSYYIGKTSCTLQKRRKQHQYARKNNKKTKFYCALRSYGFENFEWQILGQFQSQEINDFEKFFIRQYKDDGYNLYNMAIGGNGGDTGNYNPKKMLETKSKWSKEKYERYCLKLSKIAKELGHGKWMKDRKMAKETCEKISNSLKEALLDSYKRQRISHKGQKRSKPFSVQHRQKLSKLHKGKPKSQQHKQKLRLANLGKKQSRQSIEKRLQTIKNKKLLIQKE